MGISRTWCQSGEFVLECDNDLTGHALSALYVHKILCHGINFHLIGNLLLYHVAMLTGKRNKA